MTALAAPDPVLVALAAKHPELDDLRWRVRLPNGTREYITGEKVQADDSRVLRFAMDDGTTREFAFGGWASAVGLPGKVEPVLDQIIRRLHLFGLAHHLDIINQGAWLQAQPEWIGYERTLAADGVATPSELDAAERNHALRTIGVL